MRVLSLFDGISVAQQALKELGVKDLTYYASEIDKYAIEVAKKNHPEIRHIGNVLAVNSSDYSDIDLLCGGSPCQDLSIAKKDRQGLAGARSGLFYEYVRILKEVKPKYFVLENVNSMPKEAKEQITEILGVEPIMIDAKLVSAQQRKRLFWTNIPNIQQPDDKNIFLKDILLPDTYTEFDKSYPLTASYNGAVLWNSIDKNQRTMVWNKPIKVGHFKSGGQGQRVYSIDGKSVTLSALGGGWGAKTGLYQIKDCARKLEPIECERLQSLPDNYTSGCSKSERRKMLGNAFNCEVIKHILKNII
jgi:DNA (cytosine-5)-methyltransferase 3A